MNQWVKYKPFYLTYCSKACGDSRLNVKKIDKRGTDMKKFFALLVGMFLILLLAGCSGKAAVKKTYNGYRTYYEMNNGTWMYGDQTYKYRLEIRGRMPDSAVIQMIIFLRKKLCWLK